MHLYLIRHGKAERDSPTGRDEDRPLNERGVRQAQWLGETISRLPKNDHPAIILSSHAVRARETAKILQACLEVELRFEDALRLGAPLDATIDFVRAVAASTEPAMLIGHNPTLEALVELLTGESDCEMRTGEAIVLQTPDAGSVDGRCPLIRRMRMPG